MSQDHRATSREEGPGASLQTQIPGSSVSCCCLALWPRTGTALSSISFCICKGKGYAVHVPPSVVKD